MLTRCHDTDYAHRVMIDPAARRHDVAAADMVHAFQHHWQAYETDDDRIRLVHNGTLFTEQLHDLGTRFSRYPTEAGELLPWLVLAAANGISGLCRRCTGA